MELRSATVAREVQLKGVGLHSGALITVRVCPAQSGGIRFQRTDLPNSPIIPALSQFVVGTNHATTIKNGDAFVHTIEHLMAAFVGWGIDHALVLVDGPEVPIMDGSSNAFVFMLERAGKQYLTESRKYLQITKKIRVETDSGGFCEIEPTERPEFRISAAINFEHPLIGRSKMTYVHSQKEFLDGICAARTFGFVQEVDLLKSQGLIKGASLLNAIVLDKTKILNPEGLRFSDEFIRHKTLDCLGDLGMLGFPIWGHVRVSRPGHGIHHKICQAVLADPSCSVLTSEWVENTDLATATGIAAIFSR